ncbi:uncharacterized protein TNCV_301661 [Trichonephila clavipes]|nr:uncharacterized protein TNCV_301661 [Trichonephila clavipes]
MTAAAGSDVVQSGRPIFEDFSQHLWPYIGNNTANVVFKMVKRLWLIRIDQRLYIAPQKNSLAVLNHKILEANSQAQNVKLGGHQTWLSINRLWHELCDMLRRLVGTTAPGNHDCSIQEGKKVVDLARQINLEVDSDDVQEQLDSYNQKLITDELIEMHEQDQDIEELDSLDVAQSED